MRDPTSGRAPSAARHTSSSSGMQQWLAERYPLSPDADDAAKATRRENARRFAAHLARMQRPTRTS